MNLQQAKLVEEARASAEKRATAERDLMEALRKAEDLGSALAKARGDVQVRALPCAPYCPALPR